VHAFVRFGGAAVSDPKERRGEPEELDLDSETVRDLEPGKEEADDVRGGATLQCCSGVRPVSCIIPK